MDQSKLTGSTTNNPDKEKTRQHRCSANPAETKEKAFEIRTGEDAHRWADRAHSLLPFYTLLRLATRWQSKVIHMLNRQKTEREAEVTA